MNEQLPWYSSMGTLRKFRRDGARRQELEDVELSDPRGESPKVAKSEKEIQCVPRVKVEKKKDVLFEQTETSSAAFKNSSGHVKESEKPSETACEELSVKKKKSKKRKLVDHVLGSAGQLLPDEKPSKKRRKSRVKMDQTIDVQKCSGGEELLEEVNRAKQESGLKKKKGRNRKGKKTLKAVKVEPKAEKLEKEVMEVTAVTEMAEVKGVLKAKSKKAKKEKNGNGKIVEKEEMVKKMNTEMNGNEELNEQVVDDSKKQKELKVQGEWDKKKMRKKKKSKDKQRAKKIGEGDEKETSTVSPNAQLVPTSNMSKSERGLSPISGNSLVQVQSVQAVENGCKDKFDQVLGKEETRNANDAKKQADCQKIPKADLRSSSSSESEDTDTVEDNSRGVSRRKTHVLGENGNDTGTDFAAAKTTDFDIINDGKARHPTPNRQDRSARQSFEKTQGIRLPRTGRRSSGSQPGTPFKRVQEDNITFENDCLMDNSFHTKNDTYGVRAHHDLVVTKGKGFRKEKTKKKRLNHHGGKLNFDVNSYQFSDSD